MMKTLTLYQPWASLIALNEKKYETRGWETKYRGPIAIHAGATRKTEYMNLAQKEPFFSTLIPLLQEGTPEGAKIVAFPFSCVLAICNLVDCVEIVGRIDIEGVPAEAELENGQIVSGNELAFGDYTPGRYAWIMEDVHQLKTPIPAKGRQRLWNWDETEHLVSIDPWVIGETKIWTPQGIRTGQQVDPGKEDAVLGLEVA